MAPVGARDPITVLEHRCEPDRNGLLPRVEVRRPVDLASQEQALNAVLDAADQQHAPVEIEWLDGTRHPRRLVQASSATAASRITPM